jgi:hypothetical protein
MFFNRRETIFLLTKAPVVNQSGIKISASTLSIKRFIRSKIPGDLLDKTLTKFDTSPIRWGGVLTFE